MNLFIAPHNDDEVLFGCFTLIREKPLVVVVLDSWLQEQRGSEVTWVDRRSESESACAIIGCDVQFLGFHDDDPDWDGIYGALSLFRDFEHCYAPAIEEGGHEHHNRIGEIASVIFKDKITHYMTYTRSGKSIGNPVQIENYWIEIKLRALAEYSSQIAHPSTAEHFIREQREYYQP